MIERIGQVLKVIVETLAGHPGAIVMVATHIAIMHLATITENQTLGMVLIFVIYLIQNERSGAIL